MTKKKYTIHYAELSKMILSMSQEQQRKMLELASNLRENNDLFQNGEINVNNVILASCTFTGVTFISIFIILMFILN